MELADLSPDEFVGALLPTMFSEDTPKETVDALAASMQALTRPGSGRWRVRPPRTCATCSPSLVTSATSRRPTRSTTQSGASSATVAADRNGVRACAYARRSRYRYRTLATARARAPHPGSSREDGALRNRWQPVANGTAPTTAQTSKNRCDQLPRTQNGKEALRFESGNRAL